jgi:hypothetical protein
MAISSASTFAEVVAEWKDTADYDLSADTDLCRRHIKACRYLQQMTPRETEAFGSGGGSRTQTDPDHLTADLAKAESCCRLTMLPTASHGSPTGRSIRTYRD